MSQANGYGTVVRNLPPALPSPIDEEHQPLLNGDASTQRKSLVIRIRKAARAEVKRDWADVVLIFCYIITGLLDSASISLWGSFVSMQTGMHLPPLRLLCPTSRAIQNSTWTVSSTPPLTSLLGNTVYIGLGLAAPTQSTRWIKSGTSLISFCIGSFAFARFHRALKPARRTTLLASFALQAALCAAAAAIVSFGPGGTPEPTDPITWHVLLPIALVAFQACGQAVTSRALKYNALTSVVLTSIYCDLFSDAELFRLDNVERNRRVGAPLMLLIGALIGGLFVHSGLGVAWALWLAAILKIGIVLVWVIWPGVDSED